MPYKTKIKKLRNCNLKLRKYPCQNGTNSCDKRRRQSHPMHCLTIQEDTPALTFFLRTQDFIPNTQRELMVCFLI